MPDLIREIKSELKRQGRTRYWLAQQIGVNPRNIYRMFAGQASREHVEKMLDALGLTVTRTPKPKTRRPIPHNS